MIPLEPNGHLIHMMVVRFLSAEVTMAGRSTRKAETKELLSLIQNGETQVREPIIFS